MAGLASHRYYQSDLCGTTGNYAMATNVPNHENNWSFTFMGGALSENFKYMICLEHNNFALSPEEPYQKGSFEWKRDEDSVYVHCT